MGGSARACQQMLAPVHLVPAQVAQLGRPQPVPECQKDHGRVPMTVSVGLGGIDRDLDLAGREMLAGAKLGVSSPCRRNCS